jgi:hypothetical protein
MRLSSLWAGLGVLLAPALASAADDLSSGGLAPPPAIEAADPDAYDATATERELEQADRRDAGRGLEFVWFNAEGGVQYLGLETFRANELVDADSVSTTQVGPIVGVGAGVRLIVFTLGGRFRFSDFEEWRLWTLDAEFGMRIPLGSLEPYFTLAGGYAALGSFGENRALDDSDVAIRGFNLRAAVGLDYYIGNAFSIGGNLSGDVLFLSRGGLDASDFELDDEDLNSEVYAQDGSGIGAGVTFTAVAGLHF